MALRIDPKRVDLIKAYGQAAYPQECCGFLIGRENHGDKRVAALQAAPNVFQEEERYHRFLISPETFLAAEKSAKKQNMDVIGFYHSHPDSAAVPSEYDAAHAWPWYSYVILAVEREGAGNIASWQLQSDRSRFTEEEIIIE